jgi:hypothetical protein
MRSANTVTVLNSENCFGGDNSTQSKQQVGNKCMNEVIRSKRMCRLDM